MESARTVGNVEWRTVACLGNPIWNPDVATSSLSIRRPRRKPTYWTIQPGRLPAPDYPDNIGFYALVIAGGIESDLNLRHIGKYRLDDISESPETYLRSSGFD